jgi:predicted AAA+ superfamily ATPase
VTYLPRVIDQELDRLLAGLPALAVEGPKGVGKTVTAERRATRSLHLDDPGELQVLLAERNPIRPVRGTLLIDEWQRHPPTWDMVRRAVDDGAPAGSYLITGSAVPTGVPLHSGAGRIVNLRMHPLALSERGIESPEVSLADLLRRDRSDDLRISAETTIGLDTYVEELVRSGFPGIRALAPGVRSDQLETYVERIAQREIVEQGRLIRRPASMRAWLAAYAAATATSASYNAILGAASAGFTTKPAKTTAIAYRDILTQLWILEPLPGWLPTRRPLTRLAVSPKHHLTDPALAVALMGLDADGLLSDGMLLGHLFESLVTLSVRVYAQASGARVHHLRTLGGEHEVDLIVERRDRRVVAIEVKLKQVPDDDDVKHLRWLRRQIGDDLLDAVVVTTGRYAYRRQDGIAVVPAALLGP